MTWNITLTLIINFHSLHNNQIRFKVFKFHSVCIPERKRNSRRCLPVTSLGWQSFIYSKPHLFLATLKLSSNQLCPKALRERQRSRKRWGECKPNTTISTNKNTHTSACTRQRSCEAGKTALENTLLQRFPVQTPVETGTVGGNHCVLTVNKDFSCVFIIFCLPIFGVSGINYSWQGKDIFFLFGLLVCWQPATQDVCWFSSYLCVWWTQRDYFMSCFLLMVRLLM